MKIPFVGPAYEARSLNADAQRAINCYMEYDQASPRAPIALYGTPGTVLQIEVGEGPIRGVLAQDDTLFVVSRSKVYRVIFFSGAYVATLLGSISSSTGPVGMASNGSEVLIVDGVGGWLATSSTFAVVTDTDFPAGVRSCCFLGGFFVVTGNGSGRFFWNQTPNVGTDWNGLDFASAEGSPDDTVGCIASHLELMLFGDTSSEIWVLSGNPDLPFVRSGNTFIEVGTPAYASLAQLDNTVFWLGSDAEGGGIVYKANGYTPERVSTHAIEKAIQSYSVVDDAIALTYQQQGHAFYVLTFPTEGKTWAFDVATGQWHERAWTDPNTGQDTRWRPNCHAFFNNQHLVGDFENGNVYSLDLDTYTDNGGLIRRLRATQTMQGPDNNRMNYGPLTIDMETGVGTQTGQGVNPTLMLRTSNDGGHTWSEYRTTSIGAAGEYGARARFLRNGQGRNRVWEISMTDPVKFAVFGAFCAVAPGSS